MQFLSILAVFASLLALSSTAPVPDAAAEPVAAADAKYCKPICVEAVTAVPL